MIFSPPGRGPVKDRPIVPTSTLFITANQTALEQRGL